MFFHTLIFAAFAPLAVAGSHRLHNATDNLTVKIRTGTFVGNLNDTYPDVRQFKWIPYAKVMSLQRYGSHLLTRTAACWYQTMDSSREARR
jgi:hypothetical protein